MNPEATQWLADEIDLFFPASLREAAFSILAGLQEENEENEALIDDLRDSLSRAI